MPDNPTPRDTTPTLAELEGGYWRCLTDEVSDLRWRVKDGVVQVHSTKQPGVWVDDVVSPERNIERLLDPTRATRMTPAEIAATWPELAPAAPVVAGEPPVNSWWRDGDTVVKVLSINPGTTCPIRTQSITGVEHWLTYETWRRDFQPYTPRPGEWLTNGEYAFEVEDVKDHKVYGYFKDDPIFRGIPTTKIPDPSHPCPPPDTAPAKQKRDDEDVLTQIFFTLEAMDERLAGIEQRIAELSGPPLPDPPPAAPATDPAGYREGQVPFYRHDSVERMMAQYREMKSLLYAARLYVPTTAEGGSPDSDTLRYCIDDALRATLEGKAGYQQACEDARKGLIPGVQPATGWQQEVE